ncbi:MAG: hypothetical protein ACRC56_13730, partial [Bosea sp. (in: a-proteobacteria)]
TDLAFIAVGTLLGVLTTVAGVYGWHKPDGAIPAFGVVLIGLFAVEIVVAFSRGVSPITLVSMPGRIAALFAGTITNILSKMLWAAL